MSNQPKFGAVLFAKDIARIAAFYQALLSMEIGHTDTDIIVLESPTYQFVIHGIPQSIADSIEITTPPQRREDLPIKLVFWVPSLESARSQVKGIGGGLKPRSAEWESRNFRACDGYDPEGNVIQLREWLE